MIEWGHDCCPHLRTQDRDRRAEDCPGSPVSAAWRPLPPKDAGMNRSRIIFYLLAMLLIFFALRPRRSWENLRQLYAYRRGVLVVVSTLLLAYLIYGVWQLVQMGVW